MSQPNTPTPTDRGQTQVQIFDAIADRLLKELQKDGDLKAQLVSVGIDFLRYTEFSPRQLVGRVSVDHLGAVIEETERKRKIPEFPPPTTEELKEMAGRDAPMRQPFTL